MSAVATAIAGSALIGGYMQGQAAQGAANTQAGAAAMSAQMQYQMMQQQLAQQQAMYDANVARQQPWVQGGQQANQALLNAMGLGGAGGPGAGYLTQQFGPQDLNAQMAPSYQFMLNQGQQGLQASAAARGGLLTGQGAKDVAQYNQNFASTGYQQAYNNFVNNQNMLYNRLGGISSLGQNAAAGVGNQGVQVSSNMAQTGMQGIQGVTGAMTSGAAAQAAGQMGQANAWSNALNTGMNNYFGYQNMAQQQQMMQNLYGPKVTTDYSIPMQSQSYPLGQGPVAP